MEYWDKILILNNLDFFSFVSTWKSRMKIQSEFSIRRVLENDEMCMPQTDSDLKFIIWRNYFIIIYYQLPIIV